MITPETISNFNLYSVTDYKTIQRGQQLFHDHRASVLEYSLDQAVCQVKDPEETCRVVIRLVSKKQLDFSCTCKIFSRERLCKHVAAAMIALNQYLYSNVRETWQYRLASAIQSAPRRSSTASRAQYAIVFSLRKQKYYESTRFQLTASQIKAALWPEIAKIKTPEELNQLMDNDKRWQGLITSPYNAVQADGCINLTPEGVAVVNLLNQEERYYNGTQNFALYLPMLARMNAPIFLHEAGKFHNRLKILDEVVEVEASLGKAQDHYVLQAGLEIEGKLYSTIKDNFFIVSQSPAWLLAGDILAPIKNPHSLPLLSALPINIPEKQVDDFRERFLHEIVDRLPVHGDVIAWQEVTGTPIPRLYLHDADGTIRANLMFAYGEHEVQATQLPPPLTLVDIPGSWGMLRVHREPEQELHFYQMLTDPAYRLKRAGREFEPGTFELRAHAHPFDFLVQSIPLLAQAGFEIYGEEKLRTGRINRHTPRLSLHISSGIDWFDLEAVIHYGDQQVSLRDVYKAMRRHERYVKLADGSIGQIPDTWLERYRHLFSLAEETETGIRVPDFHLPLVDTLLSDADEKQVAEAFEQRRQRFLSFDRIQEQPIPTGFTGVLRPYQKSGLDWLVFLNTYGFGGCLADDMGLGKTIQVLALLQLLKEKQSPEPLSKLPATLLVVPKSLIVNWQRESARFTPGMRILEYIGNARAREISSFDQYDIILTTYGTMLRDIELLRSYRFNYAILDESQAIKNPLSQSSKAARLLKADHRLVLTGTPVENNTFELWSQFAFLNPGLLGNLEFFRREFAGPIESHQDEATARMLRKLVFPFILRRTKDQVAPELPPRSERILYTDMEPAQRKLYTQTRERYRGMLMGMLETEGINDIRMKILEGLLRLRQISIHPALVEPAYKGDAPKFELLFEVLQTLRAENHKALIFSQFVETLRLVRKHLDASKIKYAYLDGQTRDRQAQVDLFQQEPEIGFFLISLKAGGVGLNLTAAEYVIHLDPWWNPAVELQASDRAHRIGQDKPVFIYKIIARDTVEEKILQLQERKLALVQQLISTEESFFKSLTAEDVKTLFS